MNKMTVLVVDDEPLARRRLTRLLAKTEWIERIVEAGDVEQACQNVMEHRPDILLLDIQMPGGSGFEVLERLKQPPPAVVFVTAFDHHAIRAFEANAVDYVTKPIEPGRFMQAMARARNLVKASQQEDRIAELQETVASLKKVVGESERSARDFWVKSQGEFLRLAPVARVELLLHQVLHPAEIDRLGGLARRHALDHLRRCRRLRLRHGRLLA